MGIDWRTVGWGEYSMLLAGWNAAHDTDTPKSEPDMKRLGRFMAAHESIH